MLVRERTRQLVWHVIGAERPNRRAQVAAALTSLGAESAAPACRPETLFQLIPPSAPHQRQGRGQRSDCRQLISRTMSSAAVNAAIRLAIETDRFPHAPRRIRCAHRWRSLNRRRRAPVRVRRPNGYRNENPGRRMMAEDATPLVEALVTIIDAARPICRRTGSARTRSSPGCSRRPTIRRSSPRSPLMVTRWRGRAEPCLT